MDIISRCVAEQSQMVSHSKHDRAITKTSLQSGYKCGQMDANGQQSHTDWGNDLYDCIYWYVKSKKQAVVKVLNFNRLQGNPLSSSGIYRYLRFHRYLTTLLCKKFTQLTKDDMWTNLKGHQLAHLQMNWKSLDIEQVTSSQSKKHTLCLPQLVSVVRLTTSFKSW